MSILSIYAAYRLTRIVEWSVGREPEGRVDRELILRVARELAADGHRAAAAAVLHGIGVKQEDIARRLGMSQPTVSRLIARVRGRGE